MGSNKGFIAISAEMQEVRKLLYQLEPNKQNKALKSALRKTAAQARDRLAEKAQDTYTVKNAGFKRAMRIRSSGLTSVIRSEGEPIPLREFKTFQSQQSLRVQVLKHGSPKELERGGVKAFINNIAKKGQVRKKGSAKGKAGSAVRHIAVAQRRGRERLTINEKFSNSVPAMIKSQKHVYGVVEPHISRDLQENLRRFIDQALGGMR